MARRRKIGILGGTFDPIHLGHLVLAEQVKEKLKLDQVIFIPCSRSPHKTRQKLSPAQDRFRMTRLALEGNLGFSVSDIELKRKGLSYTVDTLKELEDLYPNSQMYFLTGSDVLNEFGTWKDPKQIYRLAKVVIATRPGFDEFDRRNRFAKKSIVVPITGIDVSSSEIRRRVKKGKSIKYLVPSRVEDFIRKKKLYQQ
ncbi:MAG: nicotinate-nucleotide adenylyltransferase [Candidatus Zixiibacteriota bacterium]|nr:MAG: nicotinate-nucleotide adenylyltransferase [candidate division Zixibacteria bacterium]